jgi:hypothetical protein
MVAHRVQGRHMEKRKQRIELPELRTSVPLPASALAAATRMTVDFDDLRSRRRP